MPTPAPRRFALLDAMILVAATALGLPGVRSLWKLVADPSETIGAVLARLAGRGEWATLGAVVLVLTLPVAAAWTLAMVPIRLRRPRAGRRRLGSQPGWAMACAAGPIVATLASTLAVAEWRGMSTTIYLNDVAISGFAVGPGLAGAATFGAWAALVAGRRWRPERSWVDRLGRLLGVYWMLAGFGAMYLIARFLA